MISLMYKLTNVDTEEFLLFDEYEDIAWYLEFLVNDKGIDPSRILIEGE